MTDQVWTSLMQAQNFLSRTCILQNVLHNKYLACIRLLQT